MYRYTIVKAVGQIYQTTTRGFTVKAIRVRFAPSPTGYLHLGGLRTALYNYLFAKSQNGKFILRVEDTDQSRLVEGAAEQLQEDLMWAGIEVDEGPNVSGNYGPYIQSVRIPIYREQVQILINNGSAYYCFCTNKRLELLRKEALRAREIPKYDNRCRHLSNEEVNKKLHNGDSYCIRFKLFPGSETFDDLIYGRVSYDISLNEGDPIIIKSDGYPTYHFANVVDDHFMQISHVLRGVEWQISTTKHILLYRAFNWDSPVFGHLPLLMNPDGSKLSKRQGDIRISYYRENGILPQALINFITISGGGFEKDQERGLKPKSYTMNELTNQFDIKKINASSGKLMPQRLPEFNRLEIERQLQTHSEQELLVSTVKKLVEENICNEHPGNSVQLDAKYIKTVLKWSINRINRLSDLVSQDLMFLWFIPTNSYNYNTDELNVISKVQAILRNTTEDLTKDKITAILRNVADEHNVPFNKFMKLLRNILSGLKEGPSVGEMIEILGKENTLLRIDMFLERSNKT